MAFSRHKSVMNSVPVWSLKHLRHEVGLKNGLTAPARLRDELY
jgi:hypothetical protein